MLDISKWLWPLIQSLQWSLPFMDLFDSGSWKHTDPLTQERGWWEINFFMLGMALPENSWACNSRHIFMKTTVVGFRGKLCKSLLFLLFVNSHIDKWYTLTCHEIRVLYSFCAICSFCTVLQLGHILSLIFILWIVLQGIINTQSQHCKSYFD